MTLGENVERLARVIAYAHTNCDPDALTAPRFPYEIGVTGQLVIQPDQLRPLWHSYTDAARAVLEAGLDVPPEPDHEDEREIPPLIDLDRDPAGVTEEDWHVRFGLA